MSAARRVKRAIDTAGAGALLLLLSPLLAAAAAMVALEDGRPVLFSQERVGRDGRPYRLWKFRTMRRHDAAPEAVGQVHGEHPLVTRVGRVLRRFKVDELPQLVNVLRGEMSLVGPRPTIASQVAAYDEFQRRRLRVAPGLTGWAQVNGNVSLSWRERIELDVWYVDHWSLALDARILLATLSVLARGETPRPRAVQRAAEHAERTRRGG